MKNVKKQCKSAFEQLSDQRKIFVTEYVTDLNASRAAKEAGYKGKIQGVKLLNNAVVKKAIKEALEPSMRKAEITKENVLEQLHNFLFRDAALFTNDDGFLICSPRDLPPELRQCIESWECRREYDEEGNITEESYKIKWVPKAHMLELAMKYLKLLAPDVKLGDQHITVNNWWDGFFTRLHEPLEEPVDAVITRMLSNEQVAG